MSGTFGGGSGGSSGGGGGGGDYIRDQFPDTYEDYLAKKAGKEGQSSGKYVVFDNSIGEVTLRVPPQFRSFQTELLQLLSERYYAEVAGDPKVLKEMNEFVQEWLQKKAQEEGAL